MKNRKNASCKNRGFTMVELVVTVALFMILTAALIPIFSFTSRLHQDVNDLTNAQNIAKTRMQLIENELRYVYSLNILASPPAERETEYHYLFLRDGEIYASYFGRTPALLPYMEDYGGFSYDVLFHRVNEKVVRITLDVIKQEEILYTLSSEVFVNNLLSGSITGEETGKCVVLKGAGASVRAILVTSPTVSINQPGQTLQLSATVYPANALTSGVAWSVSDPQVARITQDGLLTPLKNGSVTVRAAALDGSAVVGEKQVFISNQPVVITSVTLGTETNQNILRMGGNQLRLTAEILPLDASNQTLTWEVDNPSAATIDQNGVLTSGWKKNTSVVVTASTNDGSNITETIEILIVD